MNFHEKIILPFSDLILGQNIHYYLKFLQKSQWWSNQQIEDYQNNKLRELITHAYNNVPYYTDLFNRLKLKPKDIQIKKDLLKLPIITKEEIKKQHDKFVAKNIKKKELIYATSSGSTGEPFAFLKTKESESFQKACAIRAWYWMGYRLGDKYIKLSMNDRNSFVKRVQDKINNCEYQYSKKLDDSSFSTIINQIYNSKPEFLRGYPVPLFFLAKSIEKEKRGNIDFIKGINSTGSILSDENRNYIEKIFNTQIFDTYSCEGGAIVSQCEKSNYHSSEEYAISEFIVDDYSKNDGDGSKRLITTDLHNYAFPFIRYDTQDYIVTNNESECTCGRNLLKIKKIKGRDSDILITPSGKYLIVENFVAYFEWINSVDQIQIIQNEIDEIKFNFIVNNKFNNEIKQKILLYWQDYIGSDTTIKINIVEHINLTPTGKRRTLIRNPKIKI